MPEMSLSTMSLIVVLAVLIALGMGLWVGVALAAIGFLIYEFILGGVPGRIGMIMWVQSNSFILSSIPLFVLMGELLLNSGVSRRLYRGASRWLEPLPGGLAHSNIGACAIFAAISGSSVATAATIGTVAIPDMEARGYDKKLLYGSLAAGGTLGILIPPSIVMIIYGSIVGESVGQLFIGGVLPGIMLSLLFMAYIAAAALRNPALTPGMRVHISWGERFSGIVDMVPVMVLIFFVLGSIYLGWATPTEAAAVGAFGALLFGLLFRDLNWQTLRQALLGTVKTTCMMMLVVMGALIMSGGLAILRVPAQVAEGIFGLGLPPLVVLVAIYILYIILGMFLDGLSMMVLTLPVVYPVIVGLGYSPLWFGIVLVVLIEAAQITPPVGLNIYVIQGIAKGATFEDIVRGVVPFFFVMMVGLAVLTAWPQIALWLPSQMIPAR